MQVVSESAEDAPGGDGAGTVGLVYARYTSTVMATNRLTAATLNGATPVDLTPSDVRFAQEFYVTSLGSGNITGVAAGHIRLQQKADIQISFIA